MRSSTVLAALFASTVDVVSAGRCNLSNTLGGTVSVRETDGATGTATRIAPSGIPTSGAATTGVAITGVVTTGAGTKGTGTASVPPTTTSRAVVVAKNVVRGGSFEGYSPEYRNGIYGFDSQGDARLISGHGYKKDGSKDDNCVEMQARSVKSKREVGDFAAIEQQLVDMDITTLYTVRFYYFLLQNDIADTCKIDVLYGTELFSSTPYFPLAQPTDTNRDWQEVITQAAITSPSGLLQFQLNCVNGGHATIWVDQVFVSNEVTPDNMGDISLLFTWDQNAPTSAAPIPSPTTVDVTTTTDSTSTTSSPLTTSTTVSTTSSTTSTTSSGPTPTGNKYCASLGTTGSPGRGCDIRPYNPSSGYKTIYNTRMTMQQCGAVCLADSRCQQFQWAAFSNSYPCLNTCILLETNLGTAQGIQGAYHAFDRSCITRTECPVQPAGAICVNGLGDTPAAACKSQTGTLKSCASAFLTTQVGMVCDSSKECRDLCAQHNGCKSYSINFAGGCSLYSGSVSEIVQPGPPGQGFYDLNCNDCGSAPMGYFNYVSQMDDSDTTMVNDCPFVTATSTTLASSTTPAQQSTTTPATPTTTGVCPTGTSAPGICQTASSPAAGSTCGKLGGIVGVDGFWVTQATWKQTKVEDCALYCAAHPQQCGAYAWNSADSGTPCRFSPKSLSQSTFSEDPNSYETWYDMGCVSCTVCKDPPSTSTTSTSSAALPTGTCALTNGQGCTLKTLAATELHCKQAGDIFEDAWGYDQNKYPYQNSPEQCAAICAQEKSCKASVYDSSRTSFKCGFIGSTLADAQFRATTGSWIWSDQACWDCPTCSDAASTSASSSSASSQSQSSFSPPSTFETSTKTTSSLDQTTASLTDSLTAETATTLTSDSVTATSTTFTQTSTTSQAPTASCVATASLGDDVTCGLPGMAGNQAQSRTLSNFVIKPVANLSACGQVCLDRADCLGFSYTTDTKVCIPYTVGTGDLGLSYSSTSKTRYYDRGCYGCA